MKLEAVSLFLAGDSTMANKSPAPNNAERGWGEALPYFFNEEISIDNRALNGRSTLSFRIEGHWDALLNSLKEGDFVIIQFGHNDQKSEDPTRYAEAKTDYRSNLTQMIKDVREKGAEAILATSIVRRSFDADGQLIDTHGDYPEVVRGVASNENVPLLDLEVRTKELIQTAGINDSESFFLHVKPGQFKAFPEGIIDNTHLNIYGASRIAALAIEELILLEHPLTKFLNRPQHNFAETQWIPLFPEDFSGLNSSAGEEIIEDGRVRNVNHPSMGVFRTILGKAPRPAVIICPGGGYSRLAIEHEGIEVARWFNAIGFDAFVLKYRLEEYPFPAQLQDVQRAVRMVRSNADAWKIDAERIGVFGSSAGGHLAGMSATLWSHKAGLANDELDSVSARPDFACMLYPVISMQDEFTHADSRTNLMQDKTDSQLKDLLSLENQVTSTTPPAFIIHGQDDSAVPASNSLLFAQSLSAHNVPFELHIFQHGPHGFGMNKLDTPIANWPILLADWLNASGLISRE